MKRIVILTGAGVSQESGLKTFRDSNGLWEGHDVHEVASPEGFAANPELVLRFYNERRRQLLDCKPNAAHESLVKLETKYQVDIITQNVDDLHEQAGSSNVLHLHGQLKQGRSVKDPNLIINLEGDINLGDTGEDGHQIRPNVVWFGEEVPNIVPAAQLSSEADIYIIIGTSLVVYPAAGLVNYAPEGAPIYVVDPHKPMIHSDREIHFIEETATVGVPGLVEELISG